VHPGGDVTVSDLGHLLKKARLEKGITLEQLEETTKIRKRYLEAIEEGDYKVLPGNFYVRAFIKSYAETVGLDPNEVLRIYSSHVPNPEPEHRPEPVRRKRADARRAEKLSKWASTVLMIAFVLLIMGVVYYFVGNMYPDNSGDVVNPSDRITESKIADPGGEGKEGGESSPGGGQENGGTQAHKQEQEPPPAPPEPIVTLVKSSGNVDYYTVSNAEKLRIAFQITGKECWIATSRIVPTASGKEDRQTIEEKLYKNGDAREWESDQSVYMIVGFPPASQISVNGTVISLGERTRHVRIDLLETT
jgi:cytoskeletal protein RodZ